MNIDCTTLEQQRREDETARQHFNRLALHGTAVAVEPGVISIKPPLGLMAVVAVTHWRRELCERIARREGTTTDHVHRRSMEISHDSPWMNQDDALDALLRGAVGL
jgi:hypothetical protein